VGTTFFKPPPLSIGAELVSSPLSESVAMRTAVLKSPHDGFVLAVRAEAGDVTVGQPLFEIDHPEENRRILQLERQLAELAANSVRFTAVEVGKETSLLQVELDHCNNAEDYAKQYVLSSQNALQAGTVAPDVVLNSANTFSNAAYKTVVTKTLLDKLPQDSDIARRFIQSNIDFLKEEIALVQKRIARFTIEAPISGTLVVMCSRELPVKRGFVLGTVTY
jgi:multidrug resistance efflux pump